MREADRMGKFEKVIIGKKFVLSEESATKLEAMEERFKLSGGMHGWGRDTEVDFQVIRTSEKPVTPFPEDVMGKEYPARIVGISLGDYSRKLLVEFPSEISGLPDFPEEPHIKAGVSGQIFRVKPEDPEYLPIIPIKITGTLEHSFLDVIVD
jgi:hypothetical protein